MAISHEIFISSCKLASHKIAAAATGGQGHGRCNREKEKKRKNHPNANMFARNYLHLVELSF